METKQISKIKWPRLFDATEGLFNDFFNMPSFGNAGLRELTTPAVNVTETEDFFKLAVAAPGLKKEDFKIEVADGYLMISAEKEEEKEEVRENYNRREYNYSNWSRSFNVPKDLDAEKVTAEYNNGELIVNVPKTEGQKSSKAKTIAIK